MSNLQRLRGILDAAPLSSLTAYEPSPGYPVIRVERPEATAEIALHGAHLISWQPAGHEPVLYTSPDAIFREGKAIRGGVPICWPWFNAHPTDPSKPSHGFARNRFWTLSKVLDEPESLTLIFTLSPTGETNVLWPCLFSTRLAITVGRDLTLALTTNNLDRQPIIVGGALHTYFAIGDLSEISIHGLENVPYLDTVGEPTIRESDRPIHFGGEVDRIYRGAPQVRLVDRTWNRTVVVESRGSDSTVVWNPFHEKAAALGDLPDDAFRHFVCIETANADQDVVAIAPGEAHSLEARIRVE